MKTLIYKKIPTNRKFLFVSPHLDDAVYSAGGLISYLVSKKADVTVVNVFSKAQEPSTVSAKKFMRDCGFDSAEKFFLARRNEDSKVAQFLKIKILNLGFTDALWRKKPRLGMLAELIGKVIPEIIHVYPTYRFHIKNGKVASQDRDLSVKISEKIKQATRKDSNIQVFCPLAIGSHIDHIIVRNVISDLNLDTIYWADFPYLLDHDDQLEFIKLGKLIKLPFSNFDKQLKIKLIKMYKTQLNAIFSDNSLQVPAETYYYKTKT